jgi:drug/metabolite transporter (DMT)-like permease
MALASGAMAADFFNDRRMLGAALVCGACFFAATGDACVKTLSGGYPIHQLLAIRCLFATPILLFILHRQSGIAALATRHWGKALLRSAALCAGFICFTLAIAAMPIADALAIYFTMPFFVAALSPLILGETTPLRRWLAIACGFAGVIIMNGFSKGLLEPAVLLAISSAFFYATGQMLGRRYMAVLPVPVLAFYQNTFYLAVALAMAAFFATLPEAAGMHKSLAFLARPWAMPSLFDAALMALIGVCACGGMMLFATAYKTAEANFVAPFEYSGMIWALIYGYTLFGDAPDRWMATGAGVVIAAGIFMIWGDRKFDNRVENGS